MTNALQDASRLSDRLPWRDSCVFGAAEIIYKTRDEIIFREWGFLQYRRGWISLHFIRKMRRNIYIWKNIYFIRGKLIKEYNYIGNKIFSISTDIIFIYPPSHGSNLRISDRVDFNNIFQVVLLARVRLGCWTSKKKYQERGGVPREARGKASP